MQTQKNVMVLDHDPRTPKLLEPIFAHHPHYELKVKCKSLRQAISMQATNKIDLLVTETMVNGKSGLRYAGDLLKQDSGLKVLVISSDNDFEVIKHAFRIGVHGFLTKPLTPERVRSALTTIQEEGTALSNDVTQKIISIFKERHYAMLSRRENQIVNYLSQGSTYKDIARKLFVTPSTVNFHLQNIYVKLNVNSKSEALQLLKTMNYA